MRHIYLADGVRLRFPKRSEEFDLGVEIGIIAAQMEMGLREFTRRIFADNLDQVRALAEKMSYRFVYEPLEDGWLEVTFLYGQARPALKLVHSAS